MLRFLASLPRWRWHESADRFSRILERALWLENCRAGHESAEPGHRRLLEELGRAPLLRLGFRLGEGSGALAAVPLLDMACRVVVEVPTFGEYFGSP